MKRVVVTGMGIVSCLGNDTSSVLDALRNGRSGIKFQETYRDLGFRSHVAGSIDIDLKEHIDRKVLRFMGDAAAFSYIAMEQAITDAGLDESLVSNERTGIIMGSGGASSKNLVEASDLLREKGLKRVGPYRVTQTMGSTTSACLATPFKIRGLNYSISSACATSAHCIGSAMEQIQLGKQDIVFAGGGEEEHWTLTCLFDAMGALSTKYNDTPEQASRAYDAQRDGFVIAGGGGCLVLEELEHAKARGAKIGRATSELQSRGHLVCRLLLESHATHRESHSVPTRRSSDLEEEHWTLTCLFDAMGALSTKYNDTPEQASRAYDAQRDGFVIAGGGGCLVLEELEHAKARGAKIYAEVVGYGANSDGYDMVAPSGEGAVRCMQQALATTQGKIDYI